MSPRPVMLMILDGWGWREDPTDNAVLLGDTPNFDRLWQDSPHAFLQTSGRDVGLPDGQMGNSEVGHLNLGAGRVVMQDLPRINDAVSDGTLARFVADSGLPARLKETGGTCHLLGLASDGGVHAHQEHAVALARIVAAEGIPVCMHLFTDGRDTPPRSAQGFIETIRSGLPDGVRIGTVGGRYFAMDRDHRWDRVEKAWRAMVLAEGEKAATPADAVAQAYAAGITDEFVMPTVIGDYAGMADGDAVLSFNFRSDRIREILGALLEPDFEGFDRPRRPEFAAAVGMTSYSDELAPLMKTLFPPQDLPDGLSETVARARLKQIHMAETEKYPHVTYFFNGGEEEPFPGEERIVVPSPKVATYDLQPQMSAPELTAKAVAAIRSGTYDLVVLNFANPDMVGHTGDLAAAIAAVETVDAGLGAIAEAIADAGGALLVTADHGNCELMVDPETGAPHTAHTTFKVPVMVIGSDAKAIADGRLADVAPTLLALMGLAQPSAMTGRSLLR